MTDLAVQAPGRSRLWAEFTALFVGVPVAMAYWFGQYSLFSVIWLLAGVALMLLIVTPGFRWRDLLRGPVIGEWRLLLAITLATAAVFFTCVMVLVPERLLELPTHRTALWMMIMVGYPLASALPQEIIYRSLFFERYGALFPTAALAIAVNGAAFGFGHLFYDNWITIALTALGGAVMGWAYLRNRSMLLAWVIHTIAGQMIFTSGLGIFFYSGAVGQV